MKRALIFAVLFTAAVATGGERHRSVQSEPVRADLTTSTANGVAHVVLAIDLRSVSLDGHPATLGGYVATIEFDRARLSFVGAEASNDPAFSEPPFATDPAVANANGALRIAAAQANTNAPMGLIRVARLTFVERAPGGAASLRARVLSAATAMDTANSAASVSALKVADE